MSYYYVQCVSAEGVIEDEDYATGIAVLLAAGFFGYMLALLQRRVGTMVSPEEVSIRFITLII